MQRCLLFPLCLVLLAGCGGSTEEAGSLTEARRGFQTQLVRKESAGTPVPTPPPGVFRVVQYESPAGKLAAYLTPPPGDKKRRPAILWIHGGDCNTIGDAWTPQPPSNDQTAAAFREAGIVMLFPSLRGGNENPGVREAFFGEVDDVLAATDFLAAQDYVDPRRIYLGGHSTGGTLVLLTAAISDRYRAVFSFGPADDVRGYPRAFKPFDTANRREAELRSPGRWLGSVRCPVFVFEGADGRGGNVGPLLAMKRASRNPLLHFYPVPGTDHLSVLAPVTRLLADKVLHDEGATTNITVTEQELKDLR
jgi:acetyl esterase/lipase